MSTAQPAEASHPRPTLHPFAGLALLRNPFVLGCVLLVVAVAMAAAGYVAANNYPDVSTPQGLELEERIVGVFGLPVEGADGTIAGDLLVERFYALDTETGQRYVADLLKGRIVNVQTNRLDNGLMAHTLLLDLRDLYQNRALYSAYVGTVAAPADPALGEYLGLRAPQGMSDAFLLNYSGLLPAERQTFRGSQGEELPQFLLSQQFAGVSLHPQLIGVQGYNFLLSNTDLFSYFTALFGIKRAIFVSELLVVDMTATEQQRTFMRLSRQFQRPQQP